VTTNKEVLSLLRNVTIDIRISMNLTYKQLCQICIQEVAYFSSQTNELNKTCLLNDKSLTIAQATRLNIDRWCMIVFFASMTT
jgi:hypothetical protein